MNRYKNKKKAAQTYAKLKPDLNGIRSIYTDIRITNCSKVNSIVNFSCKDYLNTIKQHDFKVLEMFNRQLAIENIMLLFIVLCIKKEILYVMSITVDICNGQ